MGKTIWFLFFIAAFITVLYSLIRMKSINFYEDKIEISNFLTKKKIETYNWTEIDKIKIVYFSDTQFRDKDIYLLLNLIN
jgi:hypothetical protein